MKFTFLFMIFPVVVGVCFISGCKKDSSDWAGDVQGTYTGTRYDPLIHDTIPATTVLTRVNDNTLNIQLTYSGGSHCMDSVPMGSSSTFGVDEFDACLSKNETGGGIINDNSIAYT